MTVVQITQIQHALYWISFIQIYSLTIQHMQKNDSCIRKHTNLLPSRISNRKLLACFIRVWNLKAVGNTVKQVSPLTLSVPEGCDASSARHRVKNQAKMPPSPAACPGFHGVANSSLWQIKWHLKKNGCICSAASFVRNEVKPWKTAGDKACFSRLCVVNIDDTPCIYCDGVSNICWYTITGIIQPSEKH